MSWLAHLFTEPDNTTVCPVRVIGLASGALYHAAAAGGIATGAIHLDIASLGQYLQHMSVLAGTMGVATGAKSIMNGDAK